MIERDWEHVPEELPAALNMMERHAYTKIAELIDFGKYGEAMQVAHILKELGLN